jgi:hypothetical protein
VLTTKFDKSGKIGQSDLSFRNIQFRQFQSKTEERTKLEDLKNQGVLKHEKWLTSIMGPRWKKIKQEAKVTKIGLSDFSRIDKVRVGFEILFV